jgi:hypothetical protein
MGDHPGAPSSNRRMCDRVLGSGRHGGRLAMNRADHAHAWFSDNKEWVWFIIATVLLWLLMMVAIHELELRSAG